MEDKKGSEYMVWTATTYFILALVQERDFTVRSEINLRNARCKAFGFLGTAEFTLRDLHRCLVSRRRRTRVRGAPRRGD